MYVISSSKRRAQVGGSRKKQQTQDGTKLAGILRFDYGQKDIHHMVQNGDLKKLKEYLKEHPDTINEKDNRGQTPLHYATRMGKTEMVAFLKKKGADIEARDTAMLKGEKDYRQDQGHTALYYAQSKEAQDSLLDGLSEKQKTRQLALILGCDELGKKEKLALRLVRKGAGLNFSDSETGMLPIHYAAARGFEKLADKILEQDPKQINAKDNDDLTPLDYAKFNKKDDMKNYLVSKSTEIKTSLIQESLVDQNTQKLHTSVGNVNPKRTQSPNFHQR